MWQPTVYIFRNITPETAAVVTLEGEHGWGQAQREDRQLSWGVLAGLEYVVACVRRLSNVRNKTALIYLERKVS